MALIQVEEVAGAKSNDPSLPVLVRSDDARAFATFPDFVFSIHPEFMASESACLERTEGVQCSGPGKTIPFGTFPSGKKGYDILALHSPYTARLANNPNAQPADEFSIFFATHLQTVTLSGNAHDIYRNSASSSEGLRILLNTSSRFSVSADGASVVTDPTTATPTSPPSYSMLTFSTALGWKLYRNTEMKAENTTNKTPLAGGLSPGQMVWWPGVTSIADGKITKYLSSPLYVTGIDLSKAEHTAKRIAIDQKMIADYL